MPGKPLQIFISYSRVNQQFAIRLASELKSAGFFVWMDQFDIPTGKRWDDEIEKALRASQIFVFIMTPASIISENAKDEVGYAIDHGMRILPVLLEKCEIPLRLRRLQYVDFTQKSFNEGINSAKELLSELVNEADTTTIETTESKSEAFAEKEVKTVPTPKRYVEVPAQSATSKGKRNKSAYIVGGLGIVGVLVILALFLLPPFLSPSPTATQLLPTQAATLNPTRTAEPTTVPVTPTMEFLRSFTDDFNSETRWEDDWTLALRHGDDRKLDSFKYAIVDNDLVFDITYKYVWAYFLFEPSIVYDNVEMEVVVADLRSTDTFALVCQFGDQGWYEFDINGGGEYFTRYVDNMDSAIDEDQYIIAQGFIPGYKDSITTTRENSIRASCNKDVLNLTVNDTRLMNNVQSKFTPEQGQIGIAIRTYENYPIHVVVKSIVVNEP